MIDIRPATDLQHNFSEIESSVQRGNSVFLTENGYGTMVVLSMEQYASLMVTNDFTAEEEAILDECDRRAEECKIRYSHEEMYDKLRRSLNAE